MGKVLDVTIKALEDPNLLDPGVCVYQDSVGQRCLIGTIVYQAGASAGLLYDLENDSIDVTYELHYYLALAGMSVKNAIVLQAVYDGRDAECYGFWPVSETPLRLEPETRKALVAAVAEALDDAV